MGRGKNWTPEEKEYLCEAWGSVSIDGICKHLGRSRDAINVMKDRLGLGRWLAAGDYVTMTDLAKAMGYSGGGYKKLSWVENRGLPIHTKRRGTQEFHVVYVEEFWQWAEKNRSFLDFSKMEPLALGREPEWVKEQRRNDFRGCGGQRKDKWTEDEDARLIRLVKEQRYGYAELSQKLGRSSGAIQRRCTTLGIKDRPVKADGHGKGGSWSEDDFRRLADGIRNGEGYISIALDLGKSDKAVRGKVYDRYLTENADKVREMLGGGAWGDGAPEPTVKQGIKLSRTRTEVTRNLSILDALLRKRMNDLGYDGYWQRFMCMNWDDVKGCTAECAECDSCTEFMRIRPQYCARCGATFFERKENRFCQSCRTARKK